MLDIGLRIYSQLVHHIRAQQRDRRGAGIILDHGFELHEQLVAVGGIAENQARRHDAVAVVISQNQTVHDDHIEAVIAVVVQARDILTPVDAVPQGNLGTDMCRIDCDGVAVRTADVEDLGGIDHLVVFAQVACEAQRAAV